MGKIDYAKMARKRQHRKESAMIRIKNAEQIEGVRQSCILAANTLKHVAPFVIPGVTTESINQEAEKYIRDHGGIPAPLNYKGYPKATCISLNEVICHGIPDDRVIQDGDIVNVDVTTILNGFYGDTSTMFAIGDVSDEAMRLMSVALKCLEVGIAEVKPGNRLGNIGHAISWHAALHGYSVVRQFCGHGVGLDFHEEPQVDHIAPRDSGPIMREGMIFTIEPMINEGLPGAIVDAHDHWTARTEDNKLSAQYEHTILVTRNGHEILTKGS